MNSGSKKIFIVAGESSGDIHGAALIREIRTIDPGISFTGIGGPEMKQQGFEIIYNIKEVNFIGFSSVIRNIKKIKDILDVCVLRVKELNPEAVIVIDFPGFNLKLISAIRKFYKGRIIYYISPQLWAWHKSRVKIIKQYVDLMLVVFPFEVDFYFKEDIKAEYVGHPLVKRIDEFLEKNKRTTSEKKVVSILAGSRKDEIERMLPLLVETAYKFKKELSCEINFLCSTNYPEEYFLKFIDPKEFNIIYDKKDSGLNYRYILNSDLIITKSGTSTVECALIGTPFCVVYKTGKFNYLIGKNLIKVDHIAMINILLNRRAVQEFLQNEMTPDKILSEGKKILTDKAYSGQMKKDFQEVRKILTAKDASGNAAKIIMTFINKSQ
ncbi:MAG: lipid-A-disaccharide synthase [Ignavibacteria bacterium]